jgi:hypothetical protein
MADHKQIQFVRNHAKAVAEFLAGRDTDGDGISDLDEMMLGLDPYEIDTDADGYSDNMELRMGSDPAIPGR